METMQADGAGLETDTVPAANFTIKQQIMLEKLGESGNVSMAARAAEIGRSTHYHWLDTSEEYARATRDALADAADQLEEEAWRRGVEGVDEPVYQCGREVGTIRRYSDALLILLLKGARPEKYRERYEARITPGLPGRGGWDLSKLTDDELEKMETLMSKACGV